MLHRSLLLAFFLSPAICFAADSQAAKPKDNDGVLPVGADGKPLNLDFETGTLKDWTAEGDAFKDQPIKGDTVFPRRNDMHSHHQGNYWIGGFERFGDKPTGTLTSVAFKVTHPWASFLVGGGPHETTCVQLVRKDTGAVFFQATGIEQEDMRRVAVDTSGIMGKEMFIRVVDKHTGHWGHVNFDDFRFHNAKPATPPPPTVLAPDNYKFAGLPPQKAAEVMTVPQGFEVRLFAGEPDVQQPIAFCMDDRGRLWVAEAFCYPIRRSDKAANDRIIILEDTDGDGHFDKRTVFMEGLNLVSGLEYGFGGIWVGAAPYLMFIPIKPGEDKPAGPPQILLDGWAWQDTHETLNTFTWGPDGWLYGCHGVFTHSRVGKPGTPDKDRIPINAGIWRYHPIRHIFEVFAHGTSNPWGMDFNDRGQLFIEACVIPHCYHIIQNGRYQRQAGEHFNPYTYDDIKTIADHLHYLGATPHGGNNRSDSAGGGHAHCGMMIYLGGAWPKEYRDQLFMGNIHGRRLNMDKPAAKGSGYVASHGPDFLLANDAWARFINMRAGPDGNVYLIDWYDQQACHRPEPEIWDRSNGRVYKICYRGTKPVKDVDLTKKSDKELAEFLLNSNDWYVRHARRILQERYATKAQIDANKTAFTETIEALKKIAFGHEDETRRLRGLWALHVCNHGLTAEWESKGLADPSPFVRAWTIQLLAERDGVVSWVTHAQKLQELAEKDTSPVVRLYLASALQRVAPELRWDIAGRLVAHADDSSDHNLPLMYWYAVEPLAEKEPGRALQLAIDSKVPTILPFMVRRIGAAGTPEAIDLLVSAIGKIEGAQSQTMFLRGIIDSLKGRRQVEMPKHWPDIHAGLAKSPDAQVRSLALALAVTFGDAKAVAEMRKILATSTDTAVRQNALAALVGARDKELPPILRRLVAEPALRGAAIRGLAGYEDPEAPKAILGVYPSLNSAEKRDALNTLAARAVYGRALLDAIGTKQVAANDVSADVIRQLRNLNDKELDKRIGEVWGVVRNTPADRLKLIAKYRRLLTTPTKQPIDLSHGRAVFTKTCSQCHTLFGVGGKVGPDITGSNRSNIDYVLENIIDPSAVIPKEYAATRIELADGRVVTGIVKEQNQNAVTVVTANETLVLPRGDIDSLKPSETSMMPDDVVKTLKESELRALVAYLQSPQQVPLLANAENAKDLFNGKDLTGWDGDPKLWSVQNGEIVGKSPGIKHNEFLKSHMAAADFRLTLKVKLTPNKENSGVQFRSVPVANGEVKGYQADVGEGWWGKLYEEQGRALLWDKSGEEHVKKEEWNEYRIEAVGSKIKTYINDKLCVDLDDPKGARSGIFALQIHAGGAMEVRFKDIKLEVIEKK